MAPQKELIVKIKGDNSDFKKSMNEVSTQTSTINDKFKSFSAGLGKVAVAAAGAYAVFQSGRAVIESSSGASDKLTKVTEGLTMGFQQLSRQLVNLDFTNFIDNIVKANEVGQELAERLDDLQDRTRSLNVLASEYGAIIADKREFASDEKNALTLRISAMKEAITYQQKLNSLQEENAQRAARIAMDKILSETKLSEVKLQDFIAEYNNNESVRDQAKKYIELKNKFDNLAGVTEEEKQRADATTNFIGQWRDELANTSDAVKTYAKILNQYSDATDATIDDLIQKIVAFNNVTASGSMAMKGLNRQLNGLTPNVKPGTSADALPSLSAIHGNTNFQIPQANQIEPLIGLVDQLNVSWQQFGETVSRLDISGKFKEFHQVAVDIGTELNNLATGAVVSFAESLGNALAGGGLKGGLDNILLMVADWAANLGQILISAGLAMAIAQKTLAINPMAAVGFGIALVAAAAAIKGAVNSKPMGRGSSSSTSNQGGQDWDAFGLRGLRGMTVEVNGVLKAQGRDLVAVITSENNRKGL